MRAKITATARYLPERILTNFDLEKMVDTNDEWIRSRTGIETRHLVKEGEATSDMGTQIALELLEKSGKDPEEIDLILVATSTPDYLVCSTAALTQDKIGAKMHGGLILPRPAPDLFLLWKQPRNLLSPADTRMRL